MPDRLSDERRSELIGAARQHLPLGASFSPSILRKHLVPTEEHIPSQSYYAIWDGRGARTEIYNLPAGTAGPSYCRQESVDYAAPGMWGICDTLDAELIETFLKEGYDEDADVSAAVDASDEELLNLYRRYGVPISPKRVIDGSHYIHPCRGGFVIIVPDGVVAISERAFGSLRMTMAEWLPDVPKWLDIGGLSRDDLVTFGVRDLRCKRIILPESLRYIESRAFEGVQVEDVVVPPSVEYVGPGAFYGAKRVTVYDTISPEARPADELFDLYDGMPNSPIGWLGLKPRDACILGIRRAEMADFEVIVRSAASDEVLHRVYMPFGQMMNETTGWGYARVVKERYLGVASMFASSWGRGASFAFSRLDGMYERMPNQRTKLKTAINRLVYPVDLSDETREQYEAYVARNARRAVAIMAEDDEIEALHALEHLVVKKRNLQALIEVCGKARRMRSYLKRLVQ
ncbi:hypothetical protein [Enorma shizhengliae]|uniref:Uncharacterized protein n=1 Tax=Enorma shizhengliae TaxID=2606615 RepID=A0A7K0G9F5_9ACTN|nr:hypothetical protein [Enorma shizhengliae]MRX80467.1 hypothetical protein [Enorma shizhengliae]